MAEPNQKDLIEFRNQRQQLMNIGYQKQQLQLQSGSMKSALDELKETKNDKVFKAVGNILIEKPVKEIEKELKEAKESVDLRIKSLQKQEDSLVEKMNKTKSKIESATGAKKAKK